MVRSQESPFLPKKFFYLPGCSKHFNENSRIGKRKVNEVSEQVSYEQIENDIPDCDVEVSKKKKVSSVKTVENKEIGAENFDLCGMRFVNCVIHSLTVNHSACRHNDNNV